jgi:hypothetical protein
VESSQDKTRQCCENPKFFLILFDGAVTSDLPVLVCQDCSKKPLFQKFVKTKISINHTSDVKEILNSF